MRGYLKGWEAAGLEDGERGGNGAVREQLRRAYGEAVADWGGGCVTCENV